MKIIYRKGPHHSIITNIISTIIFNNGFADFDIEDGHQHIPVENIVKILPSSKN